MTSAPQFAANLIGSERYAGTPDPTAIANLSSGIAGEVGPPGTASPPTILYAGRQSLLPTLIDQLAGCRCARGARSPS